MNDELYISSTYPGIPDNLKRIIERLLIQKKDWACSNCRNTGKIIKIVNRNVRTSDCICKAVKQRHDLHNTLFDDSNIPSRYKDSNIDNWFNVGSDDKEQSLNHSSYRVVKDYCNGINHVVDKGYGLFLTGQNGVGKTFLACAIGNHATQAGINVRYYTMASIIRNQIDGWYDDESKITIGNIQQCDLLIIDDLDKVYRTKNGIEQSIFDNLLRDRLQSNKSCIFTSNRTIEDSIDDFGVHIQSMLIEHCAELVFVGEDYRKKMTLDIRRKIIGC